MESPSHFMPTVSLSACYVCCGINATTLGQGNLLVIMSTQIRSSTIGDSIHAEKNFGRAGTITVVNNTAITASGTDAETGRLAAGMLATTTRAAPTKVNGRAFRDY